MLHPSCCQDFVLPPQGHQHMAGSSSLLPSASDDLHTQMRRFLLTFPLSIASGAVKAALYLSPLSFSSMDWILFS